MSDAKMYVDENDRHWILSSRMAWQLFGIDDQDVDQLNLFDD